MKLFPTVLGVDPSGGRLAAVRVQGGLGGPLVATPTLCHDYRGEREAARLEEAETVLGEFVARNGLVGAKVLLALPADRVHMARAVFPPLREKDLREAVGLELERLFPVSPATLRYGYRRLADPSARGKIPLVVAAVPVEYLNRCEEILSRVGLSLAAAVPAGWAAGAAVSRFADPSLERSGAATALLRWLGDSVECTVLAGGEALFCASRPCALENAPAEGISLALAGLTDVPEAGEGNPVDLYAPPGWFEEGNFLPDGSGTVFRTTGGFAEQAAAVLSGTTGGKPVDPFPLLCAYGAAVGGVRMDLLAPQRVGAYSRASRLAIAISAAAALALGVAWPASVAWKAKTDVRFLDARVAALRPFAERHEESIAELDEAQAKMATLREGVSASGETIRILKELTDRLPNGTWLQSLRVEGRKVELNGLSPSASEIFPALTKDGRFRSVEFGAPITRQADNIERFKIRGEYVTPPVAAPVPGGAR